jgi:hypothetical protein
MKPKPQYCYQISKKTGEVIEFTFSSVGEDLTVQQIHDVMETRYCFNKHLRRCKDKGPRRDRP